MKKPINFLGWLTFLVLFFLSASLISAFTTFYGFTEVEGFQPFLYDPVQLESSKLARIMNSLISSAEGLMIILIIFLIFFFFTKKLGRRLVGNILVFTFFFLITGLIYADYSISYTQGILLADNPGWVPPEDAIWYKTFFQIASDYQYINYLDPTTLIIVYGIILLVNFIWILVYKSKIKVYNEKVRLEALNALKKEKDNNNGVVINNSFFNPLSDKNDLVNQYPINYNPSFSSQKTSPITINNPALNPQLSSNNPMPMLNNNLSISKELNIASPNIPSRISQEPVQPIVIDDRERVRLKHNNILLNKIAREPLSTLSEAKILIAKMSQIPNHQERIKMLDTIYLICLNNNYLNLELKRAIYEKLGARLPEEFFQPSAEKSVNYLLMYNKEGFKQLMYRLLSNN